MAFQNLMVFSGNANPKLAADVAERLGLPMGRADVGRFSDGEVSVEIQEHVRGNDVFVLQSTCHPSNDNLMELLVIWAPCWAQPMWAASLTARSRSSSSRTCGRAKSSSSNRPAHRPTKT